MVLPKAVVDEFPELNGATVMPLGKGLINRTWLVVRDHESWVLQHVNALFNPRIHENIQAVSAHLRAKGLSCSELLATAKGSLYASVEGEVWRLMTRMHGVSFDTVQSPEHAHAAAGMVGAFHAALQDLDYVFVGCREGVHDTARHLATLRQAVASHGGHRLHQQVRPLAEAIETAVLGLPPLGNEPQLVGHGDLKINNLLFDTSGNEAAVPVALVDLDTLGPVHLGHELGDMWRSWCNACGEDSQEAHFDVAIFEASLVGYCEGRAWSCSAQARTALLYGVEHICLELAARFAADALRESYFGFDRERFEAAGEHNLLRAQGQWRLAQAAQRCRPERAALLDRQSSC